MEKPAPKNEDQNYNRIILHADMDAFYAAVEQLDNPQLKNKPVVIGSRHPRSVVSTASYEARKYGVKSAMSMVEALKRCPNAVVIPPRMKRYCEISDIVMGVFANYSPLVEPLSIDEAFIDMTGLERLMGSPLSMARAIKRDVFSRTGGLTVSVGVGPNKFVAKVASDFNKPDGLTIIPQCSVSSFLFPLEVGRIYGVGPVAKKKLNDFGFFTIEDVALSDIKKLISFLGEQGKTIWHLANGIDESPVKAREKASSIGKEYTFDKDLMGKEALWPYFELCAIDICKTLRNRKFLAKGLRMKLKTNGFKLISRQLLLPQSTSNHKDLLESAQKLMEKFNLKLRYRLAGLTVYNLEEAVFQQELFETNENKKKKKLDQVFDQVAKKYGEKAISYGLDFGDD